MNINNVIFDIVLEGKKLGHLYFPNGYGIYVVQYDGISTYGISFLQRINYEAWSASIDDNMRSISDVNDLEDVTEEQVNTYILQVENLPNKQ
jgi:hypothetical protein